MTRKLVSTTKVDGPTFVGLTAAALPYVKAKPGEIEPFIKMGWEFLSDVSDTDRSVVMVRDFPNQLAMWHSITDQKIPILEINLIDGKFIVTDVLKKPPILLPAGDELGGHPFLPHWLEYLSTWRTTSIVMRGVEWDYYMKSVLDVASLRYKAFKAQSWEEFVYEAMTMQLALAQQRLLTLIPQYFRDQELTFEWLVDVIDLVMTQANEVLDWHMRFLMLYDLNRVKRWINAYQKRALEVVSPLKIVADAPSAESSALVDGVPPQPVQPDLAIAPEVKKPTRSTGKKSPPRKKPDSLVDARSLREDDSK